MLGQTVCRQCFEKSAPCLMCLERKPSTVKQAGLILFGALLAPPDNEPESV